MISIDIPVFGQVQLDHVLLDMNGTLSTDGCVPASTMDRLLELANSLSVHVITADTFGTARQIFTSELIDLITLTGKAAEQKRDFLRELGPSRTVAIGNGNNDVLMLEMARLGICIVGHEGASTKAAQAALIVVHDIDDALDLLLKPARLLATLRG